MEKIASFTINHLALKRGVFVSRVDATPSGDKITTFDIRLTEPNREPAVSPQALHTIEHLAATFMRNDPEWGPRTVYWGPMGCCTGSYLLVQGTPSPEDMLPVLRRMFSFIAGFEGEIPGATPRDCGNWTFNDLEEARKTARRFLDEVLAAPGECNLNYPAEN